MTKMELPHVEPLAGSPQSARGFALRADKQKKTAELGGAGSAVWAQPRGLGSAQESGY